MHPSNGLPGDLAAARACLLLTRHLVTAIGLLEDINLLASMVVT
jgi:hypothetical protein